MDELDPKVKSSLNKLLLEVSKEKKSYLTEKKSSKIQMWVALAIINSKIDELNERIPKPKETKNLKKSLKKL
ncbi:hypothetical protein J4467_03720 [Candidatus Woesearchaeota archaeon]|nr:hypothetical protein [Candidatus Woesearchaeota archaeon]